VVSCGVGRDLELLERWREGDQGAGEELCACYFNEIHRFFESKFVAEADDLTQQTFLACVKARDQFRGLSSIRTYLFAIARNELYMRIRRIPKFEHIDVDASSFADLQAGVTSAGGRLDRQHERVQVRAALRQLPLEQQLVLELHYWHELDAAALAELFEASPATIRVRLVRARKALRAQLGTGAFVSDPSDRMTSSLHELAHEDLRHE
jgi:RNA polymerase sigma factor (sigma-70 family)